MMLGDVAVATMTWVRNADDDTLLRRSLLRLADLGVPIAVADRGTDPGFTRFLQELPSSHVVVAETPGLVAQIQAAIAVCGSFNRRFVLYTEPDKEAFLTKSVREFINRAPDAEDVGVVLAARSEYGFSTFPATQRYTEGVANQLCGEYCGRTGDYVYGPFVIARPLFTLPSCPSSTLGWGWRPLIFRRAHAERCRIVHLSGDYECPPDQRDESPSDRVHRLRQLQQNIEGLITPLSD